jgi:hypothetical protein
MNDIYNIKYKKYKKKYILLKQLIQEGGILDFIGQGTSGCLICPPFNPGTPINLSYPIYQEKLQFDFDDYNSCKYVGKILAIKEQLSKGDSYENEIEQLLKIKNLDPNGDYTPKLIYANVYLKTELLEKLKEKYKDKDIDKDIFNCINNKITFEKYGYIISKHTGISLESKYDELNSPITNIRELKKFLIKFNELLKFIKILYENNYLHLDIKLNNITIKKEEDDKLYLIDFGRTIELKEDIDYDNTIAFLRRQNFMYSFEPKIYYNLYNSNKTKLSFIQIINYIRMKNFKKAIEPYDYDNMDILNRIFNKININTKSQQEYFNNYLKKCCCKYYHDKKDEFFKINKNHFFVINQDDFLEKYENDFLEKYQDQIKENYEEKFWEEYEEKFWEENRDIFWEEYESRFIEKYGHEEIEKKLLLNYIFYPIIKKFDMYCMGIVLAEIVLFKYEIDFNLEKKFINLIKKLLFHEFDNVDYIINEINKLIKIL